MLIDQFISLFINESEKQIKENISLFYHFIKNVL